MDLGLYIHIPFCIKKCGYCDFTSFSLPNKDDVKRYLTALKIELKIWAEYIEDYPVATVYIGGGTPSVLPAEYMREMVSCIDKYFRLAEDLEFTIEVNPGTISLSYLKKLKDLGVSRLSIGVQSLEDEMLFKMGRLHNAAQAVEAVENAKSAQFDSTSVDLIYGLPGQILDKWEETLKNITCLGPEHISVYGLTVESGTPWQEKYDKGILNFPDEDACGDMYEKTAEVLQKQNYKQYEISNFSKPGYECRHNLRYWHRTSHIGAGLGACSFIDSCRYKNTEDFESYCKALEYGKFPNIEAEKINIKDAMAEFMFLGLRTSEGISEEKFYCEFGAGVKEIYGRELENLIDQGLLIQEEGYIRLASSAYVLGNMIFAEFV